MSKDFKAIVADDMKLHQKSDAERVVPMPGKTVPAGQRQSDTTIVHGGHQAYQAALLHQ